MDETIDKAPEAPGVALPARRGPGRPRKSLRPWPFCPNYLVDDQGEVYSTLRPRKGADRPRSPQRRAPAQMGSGYLKMSFMVGDQVVQRYVHQVVLDTFLGPCPDGFTVRFKNGRRDDCRLENLFYGNPATREVIVFDRTKGMARRVPWAAGMGAAVRPPLPEHFHAWNLGDFWLLRCRRCQRTIRANKDAAGDVVALRLLLDHAASHGIRVAEAGAAGAEAPPHRVLSGPVVDPGGTDDEARMPGG